MELTARIQLSEEELKELESLAAVGYPPEKLAMYFDQPLGLFKKEYSLPSVPENAIAYHVARGKLRSEAAEEIKIFEAAERGNVTASQQLINLKRDRGWKVSKLDLFAGPTPEAFEALEEYLNNPSSASISQEEEIYMDTLYFMVNMARKVGKRSAIEFFVKKGLKHARAREMYDEAINLFYIDEQIEKKAYRNLYANQMEELAFHTKVNIRNSQDAERVANILMKAAQLRELDKEDPQPLPIENYLKPIKYFSLDVTDIGLDPVNRDLLASQIDSLDVPVKDKERLKNEALIGSFNIIKRLYAIQEESQEEQS